MSPNLTERHPWTMALTHWRTAELRFQRQKTGAHDGENGFLDMKETTLNERESEQCDEMSSKYYNNKYVVVRAYDNQNVLR